MANSPLTLSRAAMDYGGITPDRKNAAWGAAVDADGVFALLMKRMGRLG